jgi:hypothetical protein
LHVLLNNNLHKSPRTALLESIQTHVTAQQADAESFIASCPNFSGRSENADLIIIRMAWNLPTSTKSPEHMLTMNLSIVSNQNGIQQIVFHHTSLEHSKVVYFQPKTLFL